MAIHFLGFSTTYRERTTREIFRRREVLAEYLKENCKAGRHQDQTVYQAVKSALQEENIGYTVEEYRSDKDTLRSCWLWLHGRSDLGHQPPMTIREMLEADGLTTWDVVLERAGLPKPEEPASPVLARKPRLKVLKAGTELAELIGKLMPQVETLLEENASLKEAAEEHEREAADLRGQVEEQTLSIELFKEDNEALEGRLHSTRELLAKARKARLEEIAAEHPEIPQLISIAEQLRSSTKDAEKLKTLGRLPKTFTWNEDNGSIAYEKHFVDPFSLLSVEEQTQVIHQLETLASEGPKHASLHTRKIRSWMPHSPTDCFASRGADNLRFTWKKNGGITVYWLFRRGDPSTGYSEA